MAGPNLTAHIPGLPLITVSGNTDFTRSIPEKAGQTFQTGVPVMLSSGYVQKWDGATLTNGILGLSATFGNNLGTNGAGAPGAFTQIGGTGAIQTWGSVPNQASAVNIALGTPITDGRTLVNVASGDTIFEAMCDNSNGTTQASYTPIEASIGTQYGLTFDSVGNYFYVDLGKTTVGTNTCVLCIGINPIDGLIPNARLQFVVVKSSQQLFF